jgi:hypothetical protein
MVMLFGNIHDINHYFKILPIARRSSANVLDTMRAVGGTGNLLPGPPANLL